MWPTDWPAPARAIASTVEAAVAAARATDAPVFDEMVAELAQLPSDQVDAVLAAVVRELLETAHPDGLTGDDVRDVLNAVVRGAAAWQTRLDATAVVGALTGALGIDESDPHHPPTGLQGAAILLIDHLATRTRVPVTDAIGRAVAEIARAETIEMP